MNYTISGDIAKKAGANAALVYNHIAYWVGENGKHKRNYHQGEYWTYNTYAAIAAHFGFLTQHQVRRSLDKLVGLDLLKVTSVGFDRTAWYTTSEPIEALNNGVETATIANWQKRQMQVADLPDGRQNCQMQVADLPDGSGRIASTTLYTDNNQPITQRASKMQRPSLSDLIEAFDAKGHPNAKSVSETFLDHYNSNGWKVGRNAMKSWKGAVGTWMKRETTKHNEKRRNRKGFNGDNFTANAAHDFINNG